MSFFSKFVLSTVIFNMCCLFVSAQSTLRPNAKLSVALSGPEQVEIGSKVKVDFAVTNHGTESFLINWGFAELTTDVLDSEGNMLTPKDKRPVPKSGIYVPKDGSYSGEILEPGKTFHYEIDISKKFDLSKAGKYTVQVTLDTGDNIVLKSKIISITVVP
jgi:hypothetical protein